jgi:G3E family GTPase
MTNTRDFPSLNHLQQFLDYQRLKDILWFDESQSRHTFQLSGNRFHINDTNWKAAPSNQLMIIGRKLHALHLQQQLINCLTGR